MPNRPILPFDDYQRIYQVIYSVLQASGVANTPRACFFFTVVGVLLLRDHYRMPATISAGAVAMMVDDRTSTIAVYGRQSDGLLTSDLEAFHAWVECEGWVIDFMAPIMGEAMREDGFTMKLPRRMLQKPLSTIKHSPSEIEREGDICLSHNRELTEALTDGLSTSATDLIKVCEAWFRRPPRLLKPMEMGDSHGPTKKLILRAPTIEGVW